MRREISVRLSKAENGWTISESWEEKLEGATEVEYKTREWIFSTLEEALKKVEEITEAL